MRIRKYAKKIITNSSSTAETCSKIPSSYSSKCHTDDYIHQTQQVCQLNMSPWDVISFSSESELYYPPSVYHFQEVMINENRVTENTVEAEEEKSDEIIDSLKELPEEEKNEEEDEVKRGRNFLCCSRTDGKKWKCSREAKEGDSLCEHHRSLLRSYNNSINTNTINSRRKAANIKVMSLPKRRNKVKSSVSGTDYYYYSGFGPSWGKKRREKNTAQIKKHDDDEKEDEVIESVDGIQIRNVQSPPSQARVDKNVDIDEDDEDEDDDGIGLKRRGRKPIKARSLKSLL